MSTTTSATTSPRAGPGAEERYANAFAAALLTPRRGMEQMRDEGLGEIEMASRLGVSRDAAVFRLRNLGLI